MRGSGRQLSCRAKGLLLTASVSQTLWGAASSEEDDAESLAGPDGCATSSQLGSRDQQQSLLEDSLGAVQPNTVAIETFERIPATQEGGPATDIVDSSIQAAEQQQQQQQQQHSEHSEEHAVSVPVNPCLPAVQLQHLAGHLDISHMEQGQTYVGHAVDDAVKQATSTAQAAVLNMSKAMPVSKDDASYSDWASSRQGLPTTSPAKASFLLGPLPGLQRCGARTPEHMRCAGHLNHITNTSPGQTLPMPLAGGAQACNKGALPLMPSPHHSRLQITRAQVNSTWQVNNSTEASKLTGKHQTGVPGTTTLRADVKQGMASVGHVHFQTHQQQPMHVLKPMNLQEKMSWWASVAGSSPAQTSGASNAAKFSQFPTTGTTTLAAVPGLTSGASMFAALDDQGFGMGIGATPVPVGKGTALLHSAVSTPWDSDTLNALDSIERRHMAAAAAAGACAAAQAAPSAAPHQTVTGAHTQAGVPVTSVLDLLHQESKQTAAMQCQQHSQQQAASGSGYMVVQAATAAQQARVSLVFTGTGTTAEPSAKHLGADSAAGAIIPDVKLTSTCNPASICMGLQCMVSPAATSVSRVPETIPPSGHSMQMSAGMLSAMHLALDNLDQGEQPAAAAQSGGPGAAAQRHDALSVTVQQQMNASMYGEVHVSKHMLHVSEQHQPYQVQQLTAVGQEAPSRERQVGRGRFGISFVFEDTPMANADSKLSAQRNCQQQPAAADVGLGAAPTPLPVKQLTYTPFAQHPGRSDTLSEAAAATLTPVAQPQLQQPGPTVLQVDKQQQQQQQLAASATQQHQHNMPQPVHQLPLAGPLPCGALAMQCPSPSDLQGAGGQSRTSLQESSLPGDAHTGQRAFMHHDALTSSLQPTAMLQQQQQQQQQQARMQQAALPDPLQNKVQQHTSAHNASQDIGHGQDRMMQVTDVQQNSNNNDSDSDSDADGGQGSRADIIRPGLSQAATQARLNMMSSEARRDGMQGGAGAPGNHHGTSVNGIAFPAATPRTASQRQGVSLVGSPRTPTPPVTQISCDLEAYLPVEIAEVYRSSCGVKDKLYQWQAECLMLPDVLRGRNLVFAAPTSAGKSIVYEVLCMRRLLTTQRPFMLVLPTVALCHQKAVALEKLLAPLSKHVKRFFGGIKSGAHVEHDTGAIVCTIEMANKLVNRMLEEDSLSQLGALVVDELHMVGEDDRGYLLELLLTKLRYATETLTSDKEADGGSSELVMQEGVQVIGMSATMPNVAEVARWLGAEFYQTDFRPVKLKEYLKVGAALKDAQLDVVRMLEPPMPTWDTSKDPDHVALLARETVMKGLSCLVFCASKLACVNVAKGIMHCLGCIPEATRAGLLQSPATTGGAPQSGQTTPAVVGLSAHTPATAGVANGMGTPATGGALPAPDSSRSAFLAALKAMAADPVLSEVMACGIAYHHRGLSSEECELVERAYKAGAVSVLCCTSTMAVGVNLPAARVIFRHPFKGIPKFGLSVAEYRQMAGRAGRAGIDTLGESVLITSKEFPEAKLVSLMRDAAAPIDSALVETRRGMKRAIMEVVVCGAVCDASDVSRFIKCTLLAATRSFQDVVATATKAALKWLCEQKFISWDSSTCTYIPQPLGKATVEAGMDPDDALLVKKDLAKAREGFVMATDLHLTYLVTPPHVDNIFISWDKYFHIADRLQGPDLVVMTLLGIKPKHLLDLKQGRGTVMNKEQERVAYKFFAAMALNDLVNEVDISEVATIYGLQKPPLRDLQDRATKTAGMVAAFCSQLGWGDLEMLVIKFQGRIHTGVQADIVALTEIPGIGAFRARVLFKAGLRTPELIAGCDVNKITEVLLASKASGDKGQADEAQLHARERRAAKLILAGARELLSARAAELQQEAIAMLAAAAKSSQVTSATARTPQQVTPLPQAGQHPPATLPAPLLSSASQPHATCARQDDVLQKDEHALQLLLLQQQQQQQLDQHKQLPLPAQADNTHGKQGHEPPRTNYAVQGQHSSLEIVSAPAKRPCLDQATGTTAATCLLPTNTGDEQLTFPQLPAPADSVIVQQISAQDSPCPALEDVKGRQPAQQGMQVPTTAGSLHAEAQTEKAKEGPPDKKHCSATAWEHNRRHLSGRAPEQLIHKSGLVPQSYQQQGHQLATAQHNVQATASVQQQQQQQHLAQGGQQALLPLAPPSLVSTIPEKQQTRFAHNCEQHAPPHISTAEAKACTDSRQFQTAKDSSVPVTNTSNKGAGSAQGGWISSKRSKTSADASDATANVVNATKGPVCAPKPNLSAVTDAHPIPMVVQPNQPAHLPPRVTTGPLGTEGLVLVTSLKGLEELYAAITKLGRCAFALCFTGKAGGDKCSGSDCVASDGRHSSGKHSGGSKLALQLPNPHAKVRSMQSPASSETNCIRSGTAGCKPAEDPRMATIMDADGEEQAVPLAGEALCRVLGNVPQWTAADDVLPYDQGDVRGAAISLHDGVCYFVQISDPKACAEPQGDEQLQMLCLLLHLLCDKEVTKITCYLKQQMKALAAAATRWPALKSQPGCDALPRKELWALRPPLVDVVLMCWLLDPQDARDDSMEKGINGRTGKRAWHTLLLEALSQFSQTAAREALSVITTSTSGRSSNASSTAWEGCQVEVMKRAVLSRKLYENREASLIQEGLLKPLLELEMPLVPVVACLEMWGMHLDLGVLLRQRKGLSKREKQLEAHIYKACGQKLNLASYQEVGELLFRKLRIPPPPTATKGKHFSTAAEVLEEIVEQHPAVPLILEHRKITKLLQLLDTTLKDGKDQAPIHALAALSPERVAAALAEHMALPKPLVRLRGTFFQTGTVSGRLSMDDPNLQTVPRTADYQLELSQQAALMGEMTAGVEGVGGMPAMLECQVNVRAAFTAPATHVIVAVDYKQVELRLMAHFSEDVGLVAMLREDGRDPFKGLAAGWLGTTEAQVTPKQRNDAKHLAYGLLYGLGPHGLSKKLGCTVAQAFQVQAEFQNSLPGVMAWCARVTESSKRLGYITTLGGRKRYFLESEKRDRDKMSRQAVNTTCQGSAADLIKKAMISLHPALNKGSLGGAARLVHMVHDELVYEVAIGRVSAVAALVSQHMTGAAAGLHVPFPVEISVGPSWGELQETSLQQLTEL